MAKSKQHTRAVTDGRSNAAIEQHVEVDDGLLPAADELAKLHAIDPTIIQWIKERAEKEQDARINFNNNRVKLADRQSKIPNTSLWLAFVLAISIITVSAIFICLGLEVAGTIFGSVGVFVCVQSFLNFGRIRKNN